MVLFPSPAVVSGSWTGLEFKYLTGQPNERDELRPALRELRGEAVLHQFLVATIFFDLRLVRQGRSVVADPCRVSIVHMQLLLYIPVCCWSQNILQLSCDPWI